MSKFEIREQGYTFMTVEAADAERALDQAVDGYSYRPSDYNADPGQSVEVEWWAVSQDDRTATRRVVLFTDSD